MSRYYNRDGTPMELMDWARTFERDERRVAHDQVGEARVSTVWLGLDHSFGEGPPLIFETMIFGGPHDEYQERYSTEVEAKVGHDIIVGKLKRSEALDVQEE